VRPAIVRAVAAARATGIRVVGCTGRRYRTAAPVLRELGIDGAAVVQNGVLVKDAASGETLVRRTISARVYASGLRLLRGAGSPLVYADDAHADFFHETRGANDCLALYLRDHGVHGLAVDSLDAPPVAEVVMMSTMALVSMLEPLRDRMEAELAGEARTHLIENKNYSGHILELLPPDSGKWAGILDVCRREGIAPEAVMAIGDDHNDAELVARAGLGVAMGNAVDAVKRVARHVTDDNDLDGAARAIERFALGH